MTVKTTSKPAVVAKISTPQQKRRLTSTRTFTESNIKAMQTAGDLRWQLHRYTSITPSGFRAYLTYTNTNGNNVVITTLTGTNYETLSGKLIKRQVELDKHRIQPAIREVQPHARNSGRTKS